MTLKKKGKSLEERAKEYIPAEIRMFSGCRDEQTSADVSNVSNFDLPDPAGEAGGVCTTTLLSILYDHPKKKFTYYELLMKMRDELKKKGYKQIPQLSSSRPMNLQEQFTIIPPNFKGTRRAVIIGINYTGMKGELSGCQNDANNMISYIKKVHGFKDHNILSLMDDGIHIQPTKKNILRAYSHLVEQCQPGDAVFCMFAGHGGKVKDVSGDEDDGYDETMIPVDFKESGQIVDDDLFATLICPMPAGVRMTCIADCCHSGTIFDLPFTSNFVGDDHDDDGKQQNYHPKMHGEKNFRFPHISVVRRLRRKRLFEEYAGYFIIATIALMIPYFYTPKLA